MKWGLFINMLHIFRHLLQTQCLLCFGELNLYTYMFNKSSQSGKVMSIRSLRNIRAAVRAAFISSGCVFKPYLAQSSAHFLKHRPELLKDVQQLSARLGAKYSK